MEQNNMQLGSAPPQPTAYPPQGPQPSLQRQKLQRFWNYQRQVIEQVSDFKNHQLPLARIKKIMKFDEDVHMISAEAPILFAKACELFILELTFKSWLHAEENKHRTLQKNDVAAAIARTNFLDFLVDTVPTDEINDETAASGGSLAPPAGSGAGGVAGVPPYYPPMGQPMMGRPPMAGVDPGVYTQTPPSQAWPPFWQTPPEDGSYASGGGSSSGQGNLDGQGPSFWQTLLEDLSNASGGGSSSVQGNLDGQG